MLIRHHRGFSLTEILVTMTFAPLLGALLYSLTQSSFREAQTQQALSDAQDTAHLVLSVMTRDLRQAGYTPNGAALAPLARATSSLVEVLADLNGDGDCADSGEDISFQEDVVRHTLTRTSGNSTPQPLIDNLAAGSLLFAYFDATAQPLNPGSSGLTLGDRQRVHRIDVSFTIALPGVAPVVASTSVELRNVH